MKDLKLEGVAKLKVVTLRKELKARGLPTKGLKAVLVARLEDFFKTAFAEEAKTAEKKREDSSDQSQTEDAQKLHPAPKEEPIPAEDKIQSKEPEVIEKKRVRSKSPAEQEVSTAKKRKWESSVVEDNYTNEEEGSLQESLPPLNAKHVSQVDTHVDNVPVPIQDDLVENEDGQIQETDLTSVEDINEKAVAIESERKEGNVIRISNLQRPYTTNALRQFVLDAAHMDDPQSQIARIWVDLSTKREAVVQFTSTSGAMSLLMHARGTTWPEGHGKAIDLKLESPDVLDELLASPGEQSRARPIIKAVPVAAEKEPAAREERAEPVAAPKDVEVVPKPKLPMAVLTPADLFNFTKARPRIYWLPKDDSKP